MQYYIHLKPVRGVKNPKEKKTQERKQNKITTERERERERERGWEGEGRKGRKEGERGVVLRQTDGKMDRQKQTDKQRQPVRDTQTGQVKRRMSK